MMSLKEKLRSIDECNPSDDDVKWVLYKRLYARLKNEHRHSEMRRLKFIMVFLPTMMEKNPFELVESAVVNPNTEIIVSLERIPYAFEYSAIRKWYGVSQPSQIPELRAGHHYRINDLFREFGV